MLSPEQFAELIAIIRTTQDAGDNKPEIRRVERVSHCCMVSIRLGTELEPGPTTNVLLRDISARGVSFLSDAALEADSNFVMKLDGPKHEQISILCTVIHSRELDQGSFQIGAEFTCVLNQKSSIRRAPPTMEDTMRIRTSILD